MFGAISIWSVVWWSTTPPTVGQLRWQLATRPRHDMVPTTFVLLDTLPLTPNGKIDRQVLPTLGSTRPELEQAYVEPRTRMELFLNHLWHEVLQPDKVGNHDSFCERGGNSIRGDMLINKLQEYLQESIFIVAGAHFDAP